MSLFEKVELRWKDKVFTIPSNRVMMAIATIEEHITLGELGKHYKQGTAPLAKIAIAYSSLLNFAGAKTVPEEVYQGMFSAGGGVSQAAISNLLMLMVPKTPVAEGTSPGNSLPAAVSLKKPTKRRSGKSGSRQRSSGPSLPPSSGG